VCARVFVCISVCECVCVCVSVRACVRVRIFSTLCTGWRRCTRYLIFIGHFVQKSPIIRACLAKRDLRLKTPYVYTG